MNDGIEAQRCSLKYLSAESMAVTAQPLGTGALLAKPDIGSAYRLMPVHRLPAEGLSGRAGTTTLSPSAVADALQGGLQSGSIFSGCLLATE